MSKQINALKLALVALENTTPTGFNMERDKQFFAAITAIKEALAQPEQEPVAWPVGWVDDGGTVFWKDKPPADGADLYTTPPQPEQEHVATSDTSEKRVDEMAKQRHEQEPVIDKSAATRIATSLGWGPKCKPLPPQSPCEMTQAERKMFKLGWLECEAAHGIKE